MKSALIGHTGFVGSNLKNQFLFNDFYNSKNIENIRGKKYDLIVSAGTSASRWIANQNPKEDWLNIKKLLDNLESVKSRHFILISTIDVYRKKNNINEDFKVKLANLNEAYGNHRYKMELFIKKHFPNYTFARCTQLYGPNLKKNFIFDLMNDNALDFTHKDTLLQWYHVKNLWKDICIAKAFGIKVINLTSEPISAKELAKKVFNINFRNQTKNAPKKFNIKTKYSYLYGNKIPYQYSKKRVLEDVKYFVDSDK